MADSFPGEGVRRRLCRRPAPRRGSADSPVSSGCSAATRAWAGSVAKNAVWASWLVQPSVTVDDVRVAGRAADQEDDAVRRAAATARRAAASTSSSPWPGWAVMVAWKPWSTVMGCPPRGFGDVRCTHHISCHQRETLDDALDLLPDPPDGASIDGALWTSKSCATCSPATPAPTGPPPSTSVLISRVDRSGSAGAVDVRHGAGAHRPGRETARARRPGVRVPRRAVPDRLRRPAGHRALHRAPARTGRRWASASTLHPAAIAELLLQAGPGRPPTRRRRRAVRASPSATPPTSSSTRWSGCCACSTSPATSRCWRR